MHYFSLHCHCASPDLSISAVPVHYPSAELSTQLPIPLYFNTMLRIHYKDTRKMERWTWNSITHVLQRCWFPGELGPALCPNPFSTWKVDKCVSGTSPLVFLPLGRCHLPYSCCLTWEIVCCKVRQIYYYREVKQSDMTVVVNMNRIWPQEITVSLSSLWLTVLSVREKELQVYCVI